MDAAEWGRRSKATLKDRLGRVRVSLGLALQAALAAGAAWFVAHNVLGHPQPFFAPIAAVVVLAVSVGQRMRRAFEIVAGNACGILLGEMIILVIGRGAWQVSLIVLIAIVTAIFLGGSASLVTQAASSGTLVATLVPLYDDYFFSRFVDAVVGGVVGIAVMALLLPLNPLTVVSRGAKTVLDETAKGLSLTAEGLAAADPAKIQSALDGMRDAEAHLRAFGDAITAGREIVTFAPLRWRARNALAGYVDSYNYVSRALRGSRVLVRRAGNAVADAEPLPETLIAAVHSLADSVGWLRQELASGAEPEACRAAATRAVSAAAAAYATGVGFSGSVVVAQVRSVAADLLRATGIPDEEANRAVRKIVQDARKLPSSAAQPEP